MTSFLLLLVDQLRQQLVDQLRLLLVDQLAPQLVNQLRLVNQLWLQLAPQLVKQLVNQLRLQLVTHPLFQFVAHPLLQLVNHLRFLLAPQLVPRLLLSRQHQGLNVSKHPSSRRLHPPRCPLRLWLLQLWIQARQFMSSLRKEPMYSPVMTRRSLAR